MSIHEQRIVLRILEACQAELKGVKLKAYASAVRAGKSKMFAVTKIGDENANFYNVLTELKTVFGPTVCPIVVPYFD